MKLFYIPLLRWHYLFIAFLFLLLCQKTFAHNGTVKGTVYDSLSFLPIHDASVIIEGEGIKKEGVTDVLGNFLFNNLASGSYKVIVVNFGYRKAYHTISLMENQVVTIISYLSTQTLILAEVSINADKNSNLASTIGAVDIKLRPLNSSQDILRIVPGLFIAQHAGGGKSEQIFLRGFDIDHGTDINLTVDGMPVNMVSHAHGQGYADLHFLIPEAVEKVDFVKGPYEAKYGNFSTAGSVAFKTKNALTSNLFKTEVGRFDNYRSVLMLNLLDNTNSEKNTRKESAYVAAEYFYRNSFFENAEKFDRINLLAKYHGVVSENTIISASVSHLSSKWNASGQVPQRAIDRGIISRFGSLDNSEGGNTNRTNTTVEVSKQLSNGAFFKNQVYLVNYGFTMFSNFTFFLKDSINGDQIRQRENRNIFGYNGSYEIKSTLLEKNLTTTLGAGLRKDQISNIELTHTKRREFLNYFKNGAIDEINPGIYMDEKLELSEKFMINAAVRLDYFSFSYNDALDSIYEIKSKSKSTVSPKLNLFYTPNSTVQFYLKSGVSFHSNDTRVAVEKTTENTLPKAYGTEIGTTTKVFRNFLMNTTVWALWLEQEFVYVGDEAIIEPSGPTRRAGLDLSTRYQMTPWLFADLDFNYAHGRFTSNPEKENFIPLAPVFTSIGGITAKLKNGINGSVRYRYMGERPANEDYTVIADGYFLLDAVLNYTKEKYQFNITAENLLNREWKEAQFDTETRLQGEATSVSEIHFTPGTPFFIKAGFSYVF